MTSRYVFDHVYAGLKDFQRATVDYVFKRLYTDSDAVTRFLVADEVGLGKTLVARGLIARTIEHLQDSVKRIDVVYVCSNADIARQNIARLNVTGRDDFALPARITLLPTVLRALTDPDPEKQAKVNFVSFTPGTSLNLGHQGGRAEERVLLYSLLRRAWGRHALRGAGTINLLSVTADPRSFRANIKNLDESRIDAQLAQGFVDAVRAHDAKARDQRVQTLEERFDELRLQFTRRTDRSMRKQQRELVGELRRILARACVHALEPDLIILDEFQRFKNILHPQDEAGELAHHLFEYEQARVLLLSATPYKMYTIAEDIGEDHYRDFLDTLTFLIGAPGVDRFRSELLAYREALFELGERDGERLHERRITVEDELRRVMVRTERLASTPDRNGMLVERVDPGTRLEPTDVRSYVALDRLAQRLAAGDVLDYWKSTPYPLNFMEGYKLTTSLEHAAANGLATTEIKSLVVGARRIPWRDFEEYRELDPDNARMRALLADTIGKGAWQLLWLPPSLPYYQPERPFDSPELQDFTKRLVFSAWAVAPKAIASMLSYEAERRMVRSRRGRAPRNTPEAREKARPLLRFASSRGRLVGMPVLAILYPCATLARLGDPLALVHDRQGELLTAKDALGTAHRRITGALAGLSAPVEGPADPTWYWAAPFVLDLELLGDEAIEWLEYGSWAWTRGGESDRGEDTALGRHASNAAELLRNIRAGEAQLGRMPDDLADLLARMAVAGPGVSALRALGRIAGEDQIDTESVRDDAARIAWGLRSLFNTREVTALIRGQRDEPYWRRALDYCLAGNLQAVLDEYAHLLVEWLGVAGRDTTEIVSHISATMFEVLSLRRVTYSTRTATFETEGNPFSTRGMPGRFARRFGDDRTDDARAETRSHLRTAFNSPFWPFVLATTSVGQEGLDFHLYCHAVVHWNLPANPVDLEQREGRVHRYKGHAVRKNLARAYRADALASADGDPWQRLFTIGEQKREPDATDVIPSWIFSIEGGSHIERHVPLLPLSRDIARLADLKRSLVAYRLAFGQPRQEDLIEYLSSRFTSDEIEQLLDELRIDLAPPRQVPASPL